MPRIALLFAVLIPGMLSAQQSLPTPRVEMLNHFNMSIRKVITLAEAHQSNQRS